MVAVVPGLLPLEWHAENLSAGSELWPGPGYGMTESDQPWPSCAGPGLSLETRAGHALRPPLDTWYIDPSMSAMCFYAF